MGIKLTKEIVNERIKDRGIELIGEYRSNKKLALFRCSYNHNWEAIPKHVLHGTGCPTCSGKSPLTKENVNERIKDRGRGIELIGDYITTNIPVLFRCANNHTWEARPKHVLQGTGCPHCSYNNLLLTKEKVNERIKHRGIELIGEYSRNKDHTLFRCSNNHTWEAVPGSVLRGSGCPHCSNNNFLLTKEDINERIKHRGIELIGDYITANTPVLFRCAKNHTWRATPSSLYKSGCPSCSDGGGFKPDKAGHGYLLDFGHFIKFGISNVLPRRLSEHKRNNGNYTVIKTKLFENGQHALDWENDIKKKYGGWYVTKDVLPDGYTETLPIFFKETLITMLDN